MPCRGPRAYLVLVLLQSANGCVELRDMRLGLMKDVIILLASRL